MTHKHLVVLTGAGISAESGLKTFRDSDGLWEGHPVEEVCTAQAWRRNPARVLEFYNQRRRAMVSAAPNFAHRCLAALEQFLKVSIITQNVDDLHERAGSSAVLHLHGELRKSRSNIDETLVYEIPGTDLNLGQQCEKGSQLRPHIVFFGEPVPMLDQAAAIVSQADFFLIIGTSLVVYPAASLVHYAPAEIPIWVVDPRPAELSGMVQVTYLAQKASSGVRQVAQILAQRLQVSLTGPPFD